MVLVSREDINREVARLAIAKQNLSHAFKEGVKIAFGTDPAGEIK